MRKALGEMSHFSYIGRNPHLLKAAFTDDADLRSRNTLIIWLDAFCLYINKDDMRISASKYAWAVKAAQEFPMIQCSGEFLRIHVQWICCLFEATKKRNNVTKVRVEPRWCDQGSRKTDFWKSFCNPSTHNDSQRNIYLINKRKVQTGLERCTFSNISIQIRFSSNAPKHYYLKMTRAKFKAAVLSLKFKLCDKVRMGRKNIAKRLNCDQILMFCIVWSFWTRKYLKIDIQTCVRQAWHLV